MKLYLNFERALSLEETNAFREFVKRRSQREPLQHIAGSTSFCGLEIAVNRHVLVPRPETEILAESGWQFLSTLNPPSLTCLDFCTGSGCIAIAVAVKCPEARIVATDISTAALAVAKGNAVQNKVADRIEFLPGDGFAALSAGSKFDLIISNPPYIPSAEIALLEPEVRDFDPSAALDGGADGLEFYRLIASQAKIFLKPGGKIMFEFGDGQVEPIRKIFEIEKWVVEAVKEDYSHRARILVARL